MSAYELRISDWSSDVCSSDLLVRRLAALVDVLCEVLHADFGVEFAHHPDTGTVDRQRHDLEFRPAKPFLQPVERRHLLAAGSARSEERRVGNAGVSTGRSRWSAYH